MKEILTLTRKDIQLLLLDKTSLIVTFALPLVLVALIGAVFSSTFPPEYGITSYDYAFSKVMFWGLIGGTASSMASIAVEKNSGTIVRLQLSPIGKFKMLTGKSLASMVMMLFSSVLSWSFGTFLFGIKTNSYLLLLVVVIANIVLFTGIMTFLAHFVKTERAAGALGWSVLQVLACFSGIMFPLAIMPPWMKTMTDFNPVTWSVKAMETALWKEFTFSEIIPPISVPLAGGIILFGISLYLFRWEDK